MLRRSPITRSTMKNSRTPLKRFGPRAESWKKCRAEVVEETPKDEDGLIRCQDYKLGMEPCNVSRLPEDMDLHHSKGRDGKLLTDKRYLVWLTRECHDEAHNNG